MDKIAIVLDTNVFGDKKYYDFGNIRINSFVKSIKGHSNIDLFLPSIVINEIKKHIKESISKDKVSEKSKYFKEEISPAFFTKLENKIMSKLEDFIIENEIKIIDCDEYAKLKEVNKWYFNLEKPFEETKPKEFPDALTISALINYFKKNKYDIHYIISSDKGFRDGIKLHSKLDVYENTAAVTKEIFNYEEKDIYKITNYLKEKNCIEDSDCFYYCSFDSGDTIDVNIDSININAIQILNVEEENEFIQTTIEVNCDLKISGEIVLLDPYESIYDREDSEYSYIVYKQANELCIKNVSTYINLKNKKGEGYCNYEVVEKGNIELLDYLNQMNRYDNFYY